MQRRLDEHGVTFADLLDEVRAELAKNKLVGSDLSLAEIGFLLGFSEQSSFTRAFKRWTGKTPLEYRRVVNQ
jgi:AraC-like DNA-binding protein